MSNRPLPWHRAKPMEEVLDRDDVGGLRLQLDYWKPELLLEGSRPGAGPLSVVPITLGFAALAP